MAAIHDMAAIHYMAAIDYRFMIPYFKSIVKINEKKIVTLLSFSLQ